MIRRAQKKKKEKPVPASVLLYRKEREKRIVYGTALYVPAWVKKDPFLYAEVRRRRFRNQESLDNFIAKESLARHRTPVRFAERNKPQKGYNAVNARDIRITPKAHIINKIMEREFDLEVA